MKITKIWRSLLAAGLAVLLLPAPNAVAAGGGSTSPASFLPRQLGSSETLAVSNSTAGAVTAKIELASGQADTINAQSSDPVTFNHTVTFEKSASKIMFKATSDRQISKPMRVEGPGLSCAQFDMPASRWPNKAEYDVECSYTGDGSPFTATLSYKPGRHDPWTKTAEVRVTPGQSSGCATVTTTLPNIPAQICAPTVIQNVPVTLTRNGGDEKTEGKASLQLDGATVEGPALLVNWPNTDSESNFTLNDISVTKIERNWYWQIEAPQEAITGEAVNDSGVTLSAKVKVDAKTRDSYGKTVTVAGKITNLNQALSVDPVLKISRVNSGSGFCKIYTETGQKPGFSEKLPAGKTWTFTCEQDSDWEDEFTGLTVNATAGYRGTPVPYPVPAPAADFAITENFATAKLVEYDGTNRYSFDTSNPLNELTYTVDPTTGVVSPSNEKNVTRTLTPAAPAQGEQPNKQRKYVKLDFPDLPTQAKRGLWDTVEFNATRNPEIIANEENDLKYISVSVNPETKRIDQFSWWVNIPQDAIVTKETVDGKPVDFEYDAIISAKLRKKYGQRIVVSGQINSAYPDPLAGRDYESASAEEKAKYDALTRKVDLTIEKGACEFGEAGNKVAPGKSISFSCWTRGNDANGRQLSAKVFRSAEVFKQDLTGLQAPTSIERQYDKATVTGVVTDNTTDLAEIMEPLELKVPDGEFTFEKTIKIRRTISVPTPETNLYERNVIRVNETSDTPQWAKSTARIVLEVQRGPIPVTPVDDWNASVKSAEIVQGEDQTVTVTGLNEGEKANAVVHSTPMPLPEATADITGSLNWIFSTAGLELGQHQVILTNADGEQLTLVFKVVAPQQNAPTPTPAPSVTKPVKPQPKKPGKLVLPKTGV